MIIKKSILFLCFTLLNSVLWSQSVSDSYETLIKKADRFFRTRNYKSSTSTYSLAFKMNKGHVPIKDRYNAACAWALLPSSDSAFFHLNYLAAHDSYTDYEQISTDHDLNSLHKDKRWNLLLLAIKRNIEQREMKLNKPLIQQLDSIYTEDQKYRKQVKETATQFGWNSKELKIISQQMQIADSINLIKVKSILDINGWLGIDIIGEAGSNTLFLVIQHADLETQEKYIPLLREAVTKKLANPSDLALMEDRIATRHHKKQRYGTQFMKDSLSDNFYILPIEDEANVDARRAEVGLEPLEISAKRMGISYKSQAIKLPEKQIPNNTFASALEINDSIVGPTNVSKSDGFHTLYKTATEEIKEENPAFFKLYFNYDTVLAFDIVPEDPTDDYDFVVFKCATNDCIEKIKSKKVKPDRYCYSVNDAKNGSTGLSEYEKAKYIGAGPGLGYASAISVKKGETYYLIVTYGENYFTNFNKRFPKGFMIYFYDYWPKKRRPTILNNVLFENDKANLLKASCEALDKLAQTLQTNATMRIEVRGHTDNTGDEKRNQLLSENRAKAVVDYLVSKKIALGRITYKGFGSTQPIVSNDTEEGRMKNRRVEFFILSR